MERLFLPLYGAKAVVLGSGSSALDVVYECARAGVSEITLLGAEKERTRNNLLAFLEAFGKERTQIIDTEQKRVGHLSATVPTTTPRSCLDPLRQLLVLLRRILFSAPRILARLVLPLGLVISCATFVVKVLTIAMRQLLQAVIIWQRHR